MNLQRLRQEMQAEGLDAVVAVSPENTFYTTGAYIMTQKIIRDRLALAVFPANGEPVFIVCNIEESLARAESWIRDVRSYVEFKTSPITVLADALRELGLEGKRVGMELRYLSAHYFAELVKLMPTTEFPEAGRVFNRTRVIKDAKEIEQLRVANYATHKAIMDSFAVAKPGDTEAQLAAAITTRIIAAGATEPFLVVAAGERSRQAHPNAGAYPLEPGDMVRVDGGGIFNGYYSDVARTVGVADPAPHIVDTWKRLAEVQRAVIDACRIGTRVNELYFLCQAEFKKQGLESPVPHIGHSMGVELHEEPMINPYNETVLEENMVLNIEPVYFSEDRGYHIEDLVQVTPSGPVVLTRPSLDEPFFVIGK